MFSPPPIWTKIVVLDVDHVGSALNHDMQPVQVGLDAPSMGPSKGNAEKFRTRNPVLFVGCRVADKIGNLEIDELDLSL